MFNGRSDFSPPGSVSSPFGEPIHDLPSHSSFGGWRLPESASSDPGAVLFPAARGAAVGPHNAPAAHIPGPSPSQDQDYVDSEHNTGPIVDVAAAPVPPAVRRFVPGPPQAKTLTATHMERSPTLRLPGHETRLGCYQLDRDVSSDFRAELPVCMHELHRDRERPMDTRSAFEQIAFSCEAIVAGRAQAVPASVIQDLGAVRGILYETSWERLNTNIKSLKRCRNRVFESEWFTNYEPEFNRLNPRAAHVAVGDGASGALDTVPPVVRVFFWKVPFVISDANPWKDGTRKLYEFPRLADLANAAAQLVGVQFNANTQARCQGKSGMKSKRRDCSQCRDVVLTRVELRSGREGVWECDFMVLISPFHSDTCEVRVHKDVRRSQAVYDLATSLATQGVCKSRIAARTTPLAAQAPNASTSEIALALAGSASAKAILRCAASADRKTAPIDARVRSLDTLTALGQADVSAEGSGYLAAIVPRKEHHVCAPWVQSIVNNMFLALGDQSKDDLIVFVYQSKHQRELRDICSEVAIDSVHSFAKTVATGPDQLLVDMEYLVKHAGWGKRRYHFLRSKLRESKQLHRPLNLVTVLGYVDLSQGSHKTGFPLGFALVSSEKAPVVKAVLEILFPTRDVSPEYGCRIPPSSFTRVMTDMAQNLRLAVLGAGFSTSALRQCTWHVSRALTGHAQKGPSQAVQLNLSIFKFMVFGPRADTSHAATVSVEEPFSELADNDVPAHILNSFLDRLKVMMDGLQESKSRALLSKRATVRHAENLFFSLGLDADWEVFKEHVTDSVVSRSDALAATESEPATLEKTTFDGRTLLRALGVRRRVNARQAIRPPNLIGDRVSFPFRCLHRCSNKRVLLEGLVFNGFVLDDLMSPRSEHSVLLHPALERQERLLRDALVRLLRSGAPPHLRAELEFLSHRLLELELISPDEPSNIDLDMLTGSALDESPSFELTSLDALTLATLVLIRRGPIQFIIINEHGGEKSFTFAPSEDERSLLFVPPQDPDSAAVQHDEDPRMPREGDICRMVLLVDSQWKTIVAITPLKVVKRLHEPFSRHPKLSDSDTWHDQVAVVFEHIANSMLFVPGYEPDWALPVTLGTCWMSGHDYQGELPALGNKTFSLERHIGESSEDPRLQFPDQALLDDDDDPIEPVRGRKRTREGGLLPSGLLKALPLRPTGKIEVVLDRLERNYSNGDLKAALRRTLVMYHRWALAQLDTIIARIRTPPRFDGPFFWQYQKTGYRVAYAFSRIELRGHDSLRRLFVETSLCGIWLHSLRVCDVETAARIAHTYSPSSEGEPVWERLTPVERLAWKYAVIELWKQDIGGTAPARDSLNALAGFTQKLCCCLAWQEVFAPDCRAHLMENMFSGGVEGEWSAAFYVVPTRFLRDLVQERDVQRLFGPTTNNALESMHKDIHAKMNRQTGSLTNAVGNLPTVMLEIFHSRASGFIAKQREGQYYCAGEEGVAAWIQTVRMQPVELSVPTTSVAALNDGSRWEEPAEMEEEDESAGLGGGIGAEEEGDAAEREVQGDLSAGDVARIKEWMESQVDAGLVDLTPLQRASLLHWATASNPVRAQASIRPTQSRN